MKNNKIIYALLIFILSLGAVYVGGNFIMKKITDNVIKSLKKEYVPGPYKPGFDPDKVPDLNTALINNDENKAILGLPEEFPQVDFWNQSWEKQRQ